MSIFLRSLAVSLFSMTAGVPAVAAEHEWNDYDNVRSAIPSAIQATC